MKDPKRALKLLGDTAQLEFKIVADAAGLNLNELVAQAKTAKEWQDGESMSKLNRALQSRLPDNTSIYFEKEVDKQTKTGNAGSPAPRKQDPDDRRYDQGRPGTNWRQL